MKYTVKQVNPLGPHDQKYGQRYWGSVEGSDLDVSFNLMAPVEIAPGMTLEYEEKVIKETGPQSKNPGTEYMFLRKVKVDGAQPLKLPMNDDQKLLELIYDNTNKILELLDPRTGYEKAQDTASKIKEVFEDE